jgi:sporulation-control protein spo0M
MGAGGNTKSRSADMSSYGWLFIQTNKGSYFPGEVVQGVLHVNLVKQFPGSQVVLKLKGKEYVYYMYVTRSGKHSHTHRLTGIEPVVHYEIPVHDSKGQDLQPCQISIPFAIKLPSVLPGSFYLSEHYLFAAISYHLEAFIRQPGTPNLLKYKSRIFIREPPKVMATMISRETDQKLTSCCCCNAGSVAMKVVFEKNSYMPGEECKATINLDTSKTSNEVKSIVFTVRQFVEIKVQGKTFRSQYTVNSKTIDGPKKGEKLENYPMQFQLPPAETKDIWDLQRENVFSYIGKLPRQGNLCLDKVNNTTSGRTVMSRFEMQANVMFGTTCCCPPVARVDVPIDLHAVEVLPLPMPVTPQDWTPKLLPEQDYLNPTQYFLKGQQDLNNFSGVNPLMTPMTGNQGMPMVPNQNIVHSLQIENARPQVSSPGAMSGGYQPVSGKQ